MSALTELSDRLSDSLERMARRMNIAGAEASAFMGALTGAGEAGGAPRSAPQAPGGDAGARISAPDMSGVQAALGRFAEALSEGARGAQAAGASAADAAGQASTAARGLGGALGTAAAALSAAAGGFERGGHAAGSAAAQLSALGTAAGALRGRLASLRLPGVEAHAEGGILSTPHMGLVAEEGPEAVIPLSAGKRARGLELLQRAGRALGVRRYAEGGVPDLPGGAGNAAGASVSVGGVNVSIYMGREGASGIALEPSGARLADDVARAIAEGLEQALRNMA